MAGRWYGDSVWNMALAALLLFGLGLGGCSTSDEAQAQALNERRQIKTVQIVPDSLEIRSDEEGLLVAVSNGATRYTMGFFDPANSGGTNPTITFILLGETTPQTFQLRQNDIVIERPGVDRTNLTVETRNTLVFP
ncbi:MAG: hypothetical protein JSU72_12810 [Deltaproteobacteria bacterium]|nr:MAG: hypothetical protein JSU72_12810 [Deltaproteobacteria bacterium]